jgi:hypothetical protein
MLNTVEMAIVIQMKDANAVPKTALEPVSLPHLSVAMDDVIQMMAKLLIIVHWIVAFQLALVITMEYVNLNSEKLQQFALKIVCVEIISVNINLEKLLITVQKIVVYVETMIAIILKAALLVLGIVENAPMAVMMVELEVVGELHLVLMDKY